MIKVVGKSVIISALLLSCCLSAQQLILQVTDMRDAYVSSIEAGVPFKIKVLVRGFPVQSKDLVVQGLDALCVNAHQEQISIINGVRSSVHTYCVRIDSPGSFSIGPALAPYQGKTIRSDQITITVVKKRTNAQPPAKKDDCFARLLSEKETIFLGEKIHCHLYFYAKNPDVQFTNLLAPTTHAKMDNTAYQGPFESVETIQGVPYICRHVQWICCPKSVGELVIPAYTVVYTTPSDGRSDFGGFSAFFGMRPTQHFLYTNALSVQVKPLPEYTGTGTVQAIGSYESFNLVIKQTAVEKGQACVVLLQLKGSGDMDTIATPPLESLPASCKYYESQVTTAACSDDMNLKTFEYILQASEPGVVEIPAQKFVFFDTKHARYVTLTTESCTLHVTEPSFTQATTVADSCSLQKDLNLSDAEVPSSHELYPIMRFFYHERSSLSMPWWLLLLLFLLPPFIALGYFLWIFSRSLLHTKHSARHKKRTFSQAKICLQRAQEREAYDELYPLFMNVLTVCLPQHQHHAVEDMIKNEFVRAGISLQQYEEWQQFFADCAAFIFLDKAVVQDPLLFKQAAYWLAVLEQTL